MALGQTLAREIATYILLSGFPIIELRVPETPRIGRLAGGCMDLAMAMGLSLFGMFAGSTVLFFYRLAR